MLDDFLFIRAAPRQGPPAPRLQGLLVVVVVVAAPGQPKTSKNTVFSTIFMPLEEKNTGIYDVFAASRTKIVQKHCYLHCFEANG